MRTFRLATYAGLALNLALPAAHADIINVGALAYDTFIPPGNGSPGVDAFDLANLTGAFGLPPDFPVVDDLTFQNAELLITSLNQPAQTIPLGDLGPGFLLDGSGNPVVQVPADQAFTSAEFMATLAPASFALSDGTTWTADSVSIDVLLLPASGPTLIADTDQIPIALSASPASTPEPASSALLLAAALGLVFWRRLERQSRQ